MEPLYRSLCLQPDDVVYDLGSGLGKLVLSLALRGVGANFVGIEAPPAQSEWLFILGAV